MQFLLCMHKLHEQRKKRIIKRISRLFANGELGSVISLQCANHFKKFSTIALNRALLLRPRCFSRKIEYLQIEDHLSLLGIVFFGLDFAGVKKDFLSGYEPLRDGNEQEEDFDAFQLLRSLHHPVRRDPCSDLVQKMQGYLIEAETLHDAWKAFHAGTKEEKA